MPRSRIICLSMIEEIVGERRVGGAVCVAGLDEHVDYRSEEKERKESSDPDAPAETEQDLSSHTFSVVSVLFTASVSVTDHLLRSKGVGCRFVLSFRIRH